MTLRLPRPAIGPALGLLLVAVAAQGCGDDNAATLPDETPRHGVVAIVGDSYMAGADPADPGSGMAGQVAEDLGMNLANFAFGGTGYLRGGPTNDYAYGAQATLALKSKADLYIVDGGANDFLDIYTDGSKDLDDLAVAAREVYTELKDGAGKAEVVVVGPIWPAVPADPGILEMRDVLKQEADAAGLAFIDPIAEQWLTADNLDELIGADDIHPSVSGNSYFAEHIADAIDALH
jgi:lysophospholipase L1-like esterase